MFTKSTLSSTVFGAFIKYRDSTANYWTTLFGCSAMEKCTFLSCVVWIGSLHGILYIIYLMSWAEITCKDRGWPMTFSPCVASMQPQKLPLSGFQYPSSPEINGWPFHSDREERVLGELFTGDFIVIMIVATSIPNNHYLIDLLYPVWNSNMNYRHVHSLFHSFFFLV